MCGSLNKGHWRRCEALRGLKVLQLAIFPSLDARAAAKLGKAVGPTLESLSFWDYSSPRASVRQAVMSMLGSTHWLALKVLNIKGAGMEVLDMDRLVNSRMPCLKELDVSFNLVGIYGVVNQRVADDSQLRQVLTSFDFAPHAPVDVFAFFPGKWPALRRMHLSDQGINVSQVNALVEHGRWPALEELKLLFNDDIGDEAAEILARHGHWPALKELDLSDSLMGCSGIEALAKYGRWPALERLDLTATGLKGVEPAQALAEHSNWPRLKELNLFGCCIGPHGAKVLAESDKWPLLQHLELSGNGIMDEGVEALAKRSRWTALEVLGLDDCKIGDYGLEVLARYGKWPMLEELALTENPLGERGALAMVELACWPRLKKLEYNDIYIRPEILQALRSAFPGCDISNDMYNY